MTITTTTTTTTAITNGSSSLCPSVPPSPAPSGGRGEWVMPKGSVGYFGGGEIVCLVRGLTFGCPRTAQENAALRESMTRVRRRQPAGNIPSTAGSYCGDLSFLLPNQSKKTPFKPLVFVPCGRHDFHQSRCRDLEGCLDIHLPFRWRESKEKHDLPCAGPKPPARDTLQPMEQRRRKHDPRRMFARNSTFMFSTKRKPLLLFLISLLHRPHFVSLSAT